jgi:molybdenum cofactor biosynthesis protein B
MDPAAEHESRAAEHLAGGEVGAAVLTVSDTRTLDTDASGAAAAALMVQSGLIPRPRSRLVRDEPEEIRDALRELIADPAIRLVVTTGGTGIAARDTTIEVVRPLLTRELEGFGELFRMLSFQQVGAAAMLSRAVGGLCVTPGGGDTFVFALPGSTAAVELAMRALILPQVPHLVWQRSGSSGRGPGPRGP